MFKIKFWPMTASPISAMSALKGQKRDKERNVSVTWSLLIGQAACTLLVCAHTTCTWDRPHPAPHCFTEVPLKGVRAHEASSALPLPVIPDGLASRRGVGRPPPGAAFLPREPVAAASFQEGAAEPALLPTAGP